MKTKLDNRYRILLWWILLFVALVFGLIVTNRLRARIEKTSYSDISKASENRLADFEKDIDYTVSLLKLLGTEEMGSEEFFSGSEKKLTFVQKQLDAKTVGVFECATSEIVLSGNTLISSERIGEFFRDDLEKVHDTDAVKLVREQTGSEERLLAVMVPLTEKQKTVGIAFAVFDIDGYVDIISENVYNGAGYCLLSDNTGNVLIPSNSFKEYDGKDKDLSNDEFEKLFTGLNETGTSFLKLQRNGTGFYVYARLFSSYPDYAMVTVIDENSVYRNISPATKGIVAVIAMVLVVTLVQSVYYVTTYRKTKHEFDDVLNFDELTGLPTKTHHKNIALNILKKSRGNYAYAACDVSEFKYFNSTFSYEYGNTALKYIANVMSDAMLKDETVSRTSGDHFAMLLHYNDPDELTARLMRILDTASALPPADDGRQPRAVFTCGVYLVGNENDINRIRARANVARKGLKKSISNQIAFYNEADFNNELETHELQEDLIHAVENDELVVFLQPKYGISNEEVIGAEALVRWNHKDRGLLSPNVFIPLAEKTGLVKEIDFCVFDKVCEQLNRWKKEGRNIVPVSVNFSRIHLSDDDFVSKLIRVAKENDIEPKYLEIELTESAVYDEMERLLDIMYLIKEAGFGLSMDDFGSGYSSLHLLREMPVDVLKLDKGFLDDCSDDNQREKKVISHVISLAKDLQISVLAEGVETESQKNFLQEANCDMIQGYYYAKPMPMGEFEKYIS